MPRRPFLTALLALATAVSALPVSADINWQLTGGSNCSTNTGSNCFYNNAGNTRTYAADTAGAPSVTASAWANTVNTGNTQIESAYLSVYGGGLGVVNRDYLNGTDSGEGQSPEHAMDNNGRYDSILFSFSGAVQLTSLTLGWVSTDSDISVLAYTGGGVPNLSGLTYSQLTSNGWSIIGNYANAGSGTESINPGLVSSSYWLIGAYNSAFGTGSGLTTGNDYVKLAALSGVTPPPTTQVPEPHMLLLLGAGLLGMLRMRAVRG